jgi:hypothetical protein
VSDVPELFLAEFAKHYTIAADDKTGKIAVNTLDGKPAMDRNGKPVEFTPHSLYSRLASQAVVAGGAKDERSKVLAVLMKYFGASGASAQRSGRTSATGKALDAQLPAPTKIATKRIDLPTARLTLVLPRHLSQILPNSLAVQVETARNLTDAHSVMM